MCYLRVIPMQLKLHKEYFEIRLPYWYELDLIYFFTPKGVLLVFEYYYIDSISIFLIF
jgi:hypothetical protein